jgi:hypothetical protein
MVRQNNPPERGAELQAFFAMVLDPGDLNRLYDRKPGTTPRGGMADGSLFSVADGRFDPEIERFEGLDHVAKAPFAPLATKSTGGGSALTSNRWLGSVGDPRADCGYNRTTH